MGIRLYRDVLVMLAFVIKVSFKQSVCSAQNFVNEMSASVQGVQKVPGPL